MRFDSFRATGLIGALPELMVAYFLRHADAELRVNSDHERRLSPKGVEQAERAGKFTGRCGLLPEIGLEQPPRARASDCTNRRRQLWRRFIVRGRLAGLWNGGGNMFGGTQGLRAESVRSSGWSRAGFQRDNLRNARVGRSASIKVRKASLTGLEVTDFRPGQAELHFLVPSKFM